MTSELNQQQIWEKIAEPWSKFRNRPPQEVINFLKDKEGKVLDLGCGSGRNFIKNDNIEYYGIDFSSEMIKLAQKAAKAQAIQAKLKQGDATNISFEDNFFDAALFISTLHCIEDEGARKRALEELFRVLKEGSEAMISVWNKGAGGRLSSLDAKEGFINWSKDGRKYPRYYYAYDKPELEQLLQEIGFTIINSSIYGDEKHSKKNLVFYVKK